MEEKEKLQGYLHDVSTIKKSEKVPYFDMCIQTESIYIDMCIQTEEFKMQVI